ncbi:inorganic phosphate transporter [Geobacillus sp. NFOSA3]|jgi:inorganic phosphate transporter, PiT family|uniref:PiT family inorganic phosphate transporter n=1 Tax=Parageobacillus toebii NBRC 107807 TaxID=1223503 RepID=A0A6G9J129_9BACL|nr:inorganic phosphate transporter [Parageobacillus toebii]NNU94179.1 inorganic phosphate transporter [Geobacillus sp. NFOSA3]MBB3869262.1 PiT family inorganic phosphate transporter [Parageobacillus toebii NBRC 107807]MED4968896.1 inorganic phosphate transporter [Parageobacillus toebii]QIQ31814.1 inorganic phosphate transporter [Parageobacillus toebii NBRC 107807]QSB49645.1 inorganic phosphate transporter [Parageobacillus toebii]
MDMIFLLTALIVIFALAFDFINGFHDTANAIATSVSTRALAPRQAIILAATMNFIGALTFTGVAKTITKDIVDPFALENGSVVILAALTAAIAWNLITWYYGIPSSSSHALIGSVAGAAISAAGFDILHYEGFLKIMESLVISPFLALGVGFVMMTLFRFIFKNANLSRTTKGFRMFQVVTASLQAYTHGTNDAQKAMGIITMALIAAGYHTSTDIPEWVRISAATAMGLGTAVGGWKIIKTVGGKIMKIRPINGAAADLSSALIIFGATTIHLPVSTTHVISSAIMGVGAAQRVKGVKWGVAQRIVLTWIITLPVSALIAGFVYQIFRLFF